MATSVLCGQKAPLAVRPVMGARVAAMVKAVGARLAPQAAKGVQAVVVSSGAAGGPSRAHAQPRRVAQVAASAGLAAALGKLAVAEQKVVAVAVAPRSKPS